MPTRKDTTTGGAHVCGPGCPGRGSAGTAGQVAAAYRHHRVAMEDQLARQLAGRTRREALRRPGWWWDWSEEAIAWRDGPGRYERPGDYTVNATTVPELWIRETIARRRIEQLARVRFLVVEGHAQAWEIEHALARGEASYAGPYFQAEARVVREALAARKATT